MAEAVEPEPSASAVEGAGQSAQRHEKLARLVLGILIVLPFAVLLPRVFLGGTPVPATRPPAWVPLVFVTASRWPLRSELEGVEPWATWDRRATRHPQLYTPAASPAAAAASFWTARWPAAQGVLSNADALPDGAWTLASAAQRSGAPTGAFLAEPFVSATNLGGFETVVELAGEPGDEAQLADELAQRAAAFLAAHADERALVWVHLVEAGPAGAHVAAVLARLARELEVSGNAADALTIVTGFGTAVPAARDGDARDTDDRAYRVPFWVRLPTGLLAGRRSTGAASLVDVVGTLAREPLLLPLPDVAHGQSPTQSETANFLHALNGGGGYSWLFVQSPDSELLRFGKTRAVSSHRPPRGPEDVSFWQAPDPTRDRGFQPVTDPAFLGELRAQYWELAVRAYGQSTPARPATVPEAWRGRDGW